MRPTALALAAIVATVLLSACAAGTASPAAPSPANVASPSGPPASSPSAGSASRPPATPASPGTAAPASTGPSATPSPTTETTMPPFTLTSTDIAAGDLIPRRFTCDGADVSPELDWSGVPEGAAALVLVVDDPDARGFVHWTVLDLTASATGGLPRGVSTSPDAPAQGTNDFGRPGWGGPCPP